MTVFRCCADESADQNPRQNFLYGGFAAPASDWDTFFADAWTDRVLAGPPSIPYVHMTDILSPKWQAAHGLAAWDVDRRLGQAARVIGSCGSLIPIVWSVSEEQFNSLILPYAPKRHSGLEQPDYLAFLAFAFVTLQYLRLYRPEAEQVDFWVEKNDRITTRMDRFHSRLKANLDELDQPELARLVGEFRAVRKDCIPAQAADIICWHERNRFRGTLDRLGLRRYSQMVHKRDGHRNDLGSVLLKGVNESMIRQQFPRLR